MPTIPHAPSDEWRRAAARHADMTDSAESHLEQRIMQLERALVDRRYRRRLRRQLREADRAYSWAGPDWDDRRSESATAEWLRYHGGSR